MSHDQSATIALNRKRQEEALTKALAEITTAEFWDELGPELAQKFHYAARFIFSKGIEYGVVEMRTMIQEAVKDKPIS